MKRLFSTLFIITFFLSLFSRCSNSNSDAIREKFVEDSTAAAKKYGDSMILVKQKFDDSVKRVTDALRTLGIHSLDKEDISCDSAKKLLSGGDPINPKYYIFLQMLATDCICKRWNQATPDNQQAVIASEDSENNKILFNTISYKTGKKIVDIAGPVIVATITAENGGSPVVGAIAEVAVSYSMNAYLEAAKDNDPLLIILPQQIPAIKLTKDAYQIATKLNLDKPITIQMDGVKKAYALTAAAVNAAGEFAAKTGMPVVKVGNVPIVLPPGSPTIDKDGTIHVPLVPVPPGLPHWVPRPPSIPIPLPHIHI